MSVRVRFAPSPTGYLHVGGARTALYCFLYARHCGGEFVLRVEDTDVARSSREFEEAQINDLKWLGANYDEGPEIGGPYTPYRQSERLDIYKHYAEQLVSEEKAFYCFCSEELLAQKKAEAEQAGLAPHYDGTCHNLTSAEVKKRLRDGEKATIRFKAIPKEYRFVDHVRDEVIFPIGMVGDFVILRSDGNPVYNFCCVIDDWLMNITHVIRAEEHLPNTLRQLMLYESLGAPVPEFVHLSLIIGEDRQKLSKRHGATSVGHFKEQGYLPSAMMNYLVLLGWSHPTEKDIFYQEELISLFDINRFSKSPAVFDYQKLRWVNGQHLRNLSPEELWTLGSSYIPKEHPFHLQAKEWQIECWQLFKNKIDLFPEMIEHLSLLFTENLPHNPTWSDILSWDTTPILAQYLKGEVDKITDPFVSSTLVNQWIEHCKSQLKIKGKFLMMGLRGIVTGQDHGPDLIGLLTLMPLSILRNRLEDSCKQLKLS